jgi:hypothetical protein
LKAFSSERPTSSSMKSGDNLKTTEGSCTFIYPPYLEL